MKWTATLEVDGRRFSATSPSVDFDRSSAILSRSPSRQSVTVTADFGADLRAFASRGHDVTRGRLTVRLNDRVVSQGRPSVEYGAGARSVRMVLTEDVRADQGVFPGRHEVGVRLGDDAAAAESSDDSDLVTPSIDRGAPPARPGTWPTADKSADGKGYPIVFGSPGRWDTAWGLEGYDVRAGNARPTLLIAGHRLNGIAGAAPAVRVRPYHFDRDDYVTYTVAHQVDGLGRTVAVLDLTTSPTSGTSFGRDTLNRYFVQAHAAQGYGPGAGTVAELLLAHSSLRVDRDAWAAARDELDRYVLAGAVTAAVRPVEYLERVLLPLLPCSLDVGPNGIRPALWRLDARASDATQRLTLGPDLAWMSGPEIVPPTATEVALRYAYDAQADRMTGFAQASERTHAHLANNGQRRPGKPLETYIVSDPAVASLVIGWQSLAWGVQRRRVGYSLPVVRFGVGTARELRPGDVVTITDAARGLSSAVALVEGVRQSSGRLSASMLLLDSPTFARWGG
jgi:hypothetical protein